MVECPYCHGSKEHLYPTVKISSRGTKIHSVMQVTCVLCKGMGTITNKAAYQYHLGNEMWCQCILVDPERIQTVGENVHPEISQHHYRCGDCGKVTQVG